DTDGGRGRGQGQLPVVQRRLEFAFVARFNGPHGSASRGGDRAGPPGHPRGRPGASARPWATSTGPGSQARPGARDGLPPTAATARGGTTPTGPTPGAS